MAATANHVPRPRADRKIQRGRMASARPRKVKPQEGPGLRGGAAGALMAIPAGRVRWPRASEAGYVRPKPRRNERAKGRAVALRLPRWTETKPGRHRSRPVPGRR